MKVKAAVGLRVPQEHQPQQYITAEQPMEVVDSVYYQRLITSGDLLIHEVPATTAAPARRQPKPKGSKHGQS